jgi:uncharacterized membrane protein YgaE (UPF0421/DUF939 family)
LPPRCSTTSKQGSPRSVIAVEVTRGQQVRHAIELVLGVTLGIGVAVLLGSVIGNPPVRIGIVVGVAMTLALLISGSLVLVVQASLAAIFLAATPSPTGGLAGEHLGEALIGGGVALVMTQLLFPLDPIKHLNQAAEPVFNRLADALEQAACWVGRRGPSPGQAGPGAGPRDRPAGAQLPAGAHGRLPGRPAGAVPTLGAGRA